MRKLFRVGPVLMLVPTLLWAIAWYLILNGEDESWYIRWPLVGFLALVLVWHVALLIFEKRRLAYLAYALAHIPVFLVTYEFSLIFATHFPL
jgi:hypothetical protein